MGSKPAGMQSVSSTLTSLPPARHLGSFDSHGEDVSESLLINKKLFADTGKP